MKCAVCAGSLRGKHLSGQLWEDGLFKLREEETFTRRSEPETTLEG